MLSSLRTRFAKIASGGALRESFYYAGGLIATRAIGLAMLPVNTRLLTLTEFGRLEVLMAFADLGAVLFGLALPTTLSRFVGLVDTWEKRRDVCAHIFAVAIITSCVLGAIGFAAAGEIAHLLPGDPTPTEVRLLVVVLCTESLLSVGLTWLRMRSQAGVFFALSVGRSMIFAVLSFSLMMAGYGLVGVLTASAIAAVFQAVGVGYVVLRETGVRLRGVEWWPLTIYSGPLLLSAVAMFALGSLDRWFLADAVGTEELARYGVAVRLGAITAVLLQPFHMWWFPKRFIVLVEPNGVARSAHVVGIGLVITMLGGVIVALGGPFMIHLMTPPAYYSAALLIPWLALIYVMQEFGSLLELGSFLRKDGFLPLITNLLGAGIAVGLYVFLIPAYGVPGAIAATLAAQTVRTIIIHLISQYYVRLPYAGGRLTVVAAVALGTTAAAFFLLPPALVVLGGFLAVPITALTAYALGLFNRFTPAPEAA